MKQTALLNHDLCLLSFGTTEVCGHAISVLLIKTSWTVARGRNNWELYRQQISKGSSEMFHVFIRHCPRTPHSVAAHVVARHLLSLSDACSNTSQINKSVLFASGTPD